MHVYIKRQWCKKHTIHLQYFSIIKKKREKKKLAIKQQK